MPTVRAQGRTFTGHPGENHRWVLLKSKGWISTMAMLGRSDGFIDT
ncbi:hypothetical protein [Lyngbya confervoides]|uniref:Uncharacterized protein n=1 Tax=Lyngbya confervoides BDU141951 TaxID=1574623 RepID=A0ABD4SZ14_9CYAN|nr:hypothetical protein [Lyngbya confervoides]MCM1981639.1 hypothetical protein [Lyngbya confervoides BDU141951]